MKTIEAIRLRVKETMAYRLLSICVHFNKVTSAIAANKRMEKGLARMALAWRVASAFVRESWLPQDYFSYGYEGMTKAERHDFVSEYEFAAFKARLNNYPERDMSANKWNTYCLMKDYYGRKACMLPSKAEASAKDVCDEINQVWSGEVCAEKPFVIKPLWQCSGMGVYVEHLSIPCTVDCVEELMKDFDSSVIMEELIVQSQVLSQFHPHSVNTVRINTYRKGKDVRIFLPYFRIGRGENFVDNTNHGGILASIDLESGVVEAAYDTQNNCYPQHPDTHVTFTGFQMPRWEEAKRIVVELALKFEYLQLLGWDLALTDNGWVVVEVNSDPGIKIAQKHFRAEFEYLKNM